MKKKYYIVTTTLLPGVSVARSQSHIRLDLQKTMQLVSDSSLEAFCTQNMYLSGCWEYRTYKANRLPSLTLGMTPAEYNRDITKRYDSENNLDVHRSQQLLYASGNLAIQQSFDLTGDIFYPRSQLGYMCSFDGGKSTQFISVPIQLGYSQSLVGYNSFKWERKIEPFKYEKVKKEFVYNAEAVSVQVTAYSFNLAMARTEYNLAKESMVSSDTLYNIGVQRQKIAAISRADLLTSKLDVVNVRSTLQNKASALKRVMPSLVSFLNSDKNTVIDIDSSVRPQELAVPVDKALQMAYEDNPQPLGLKQNILEAERNVDKTKKESRLSASVSASIDFNQVADNLGDVHHKPMQQNLVSVSVSIPLVDWGVRKGKYSMARNNLDVVKTSARQDEISLDEEVIMTVNDFNIQQNLITSAEEAFDLSILVYNKTRQRFIIGKVDINSLTLSLNCQQETQQNYIFILQNYRLNYYKICKLTLHDFATGIPLTEKFDCVGGQLVRQCYLTLKRWIILLK